MSDQPKVPVVLEPLLSEVRRQRERVLRAGRAKSVHDLRVAARRLEEALRLLDGASSGPGVSRLARRLRSIRRGLGPVRDADVRVKSLRALEKTLAGRLKERAKTCGRRARRGAAALRADTRGIPVRDVERRMGDVLEHLPPIDLAGVMRDRGMAHLSDRSRTVARALAGARRGASRELHRLRIAIKRYRYTMELMATLGAPGLKERLAEARRLQERLGLLRDREQLLAWIRRNAPDAELARHVARQAAASRNSLRRSLLTPGLARRITEEGR